MKSIICVCLFLVTFVKTDEPLPSLPEDGSCELGKSYQDGCNICSCFSEKALLCKRTENCADKDKEEIAPAENGKESDAQKFCKEGDLKYGPLGECSTCICVKENDGTNEWHCDDKACPSNRSKRGVGTIPDLKNTPCAPNDSFRLDCNKCYCNSAKSGYRCTENICVPDNATEILIAENSTDTDAVFFNITSTLNETTNSNNSTERTTSIETTKLVEASTSVTQANTTASESTLSLPSSTTPKSVSNSTTEDSVLSLG